jgi:hypothetical protein
VNARHLPNLHALPVGAKGNHHPYQSCDCRPLQATDMLEGAGGRVIYIHQSGGDPMPKNPITVKALQELGRADLDTDCSCPPCLRLGDAIGAHGETLHAVAEAAREVDRAHRLPSVNGRPRNQRLDGLPW